MAGIGAKKLSQIYGSLVQLDNGITGFDSTVRTIKDGAGNSSSINISKEKFKVTPQSSDSTDIFKVTDKDGNSLLVVDGTNDKILAGIGQMAINTQYAYFGVAHSISLNFIADTHHPLTFQGNNQAPTEEHNFSLGTGTDPATSFTTADGGGTDAALVVPCLMYVPDNISIDSVISIEGADAATGDTTRCHLMSYTFTSGSTSCLSSGTLLAHNSDVANAGSEQAYLTTWTVDSASVTAGKVILATFRSDSINSDYSVSVIIKYHTV